MEADDLRRVVQYAPFERLVRQSLVGGPTRVATDAVYLIMEAAVQYAHEIYKDSYNVTVMSARRRVLMMRDLEVTVLNKGSAICDDVVDDEEEEDDEQREGGV